MQPETAKLINHVNAHHDKFMKGFYELLQFRSVSTDPIYQSELNQCAQWIADKASQVGLKNARLIPTGGHPIVYAEWLEAGPDQPTVLFYAHYDVQPPDPLELWEHDPFKPILRDGKLVALNVQTCGVPGGDVAGMINDRTAALSGFLDSLQKNRASGGVQ